MYTVFVRSMFVLSFIFLLVANANAQSLPPANHLITKADAKRYIDNFKASPDAAVLTVTAGAFHREIVDKILSQSGCAGIRIYYGKTDDAKPTLIIVGIDAAGNDLVDGVIAQLMIPCPPVCSGTSISK